MVQASPETLIARSRVVADGWGLGRVAGASGAPRQAIVKVISNRRSAGGVHHLIDYVARTRKEDRETGAYGTVALYDELGQPLTSTSAHGVADEDWDLLADRDNRSPAAAVLVDAGRAQEAGALPEKDRLRNVQVWHLTWSVRPDLPTDDAEEGEREKAQGGAMPAADETAARLREAAAGAILEMLHMEQGRRAIWALHTDEPNRPHVHLVVKSEDDSGRRLCFDVDNDAIDHMRAVFVHHARAAGLNVVAERREDREDVRRRVLDGAEPLRPNRKMVHLKRGTDPAERVPSWFLRHGLDHDRRRARLAERWRDALWAESAALRDRLEGLGHPLSRDEDLVSSVLVAAADMDEGDRRSVRAALKHVRRAAGERIAAAGRAARAAAPVRRLLGGGRASVAADLLDLYEAVEDSFVDPRAAVDSWALMASEDKGFADWHMRFNPMIFGEVLAPARQHRRRGDLAAVLRATRLPRRPRPAEGETIEDLQDARAAAEEARQPVAQKRDRGLIVASLSRLAERLGDDLRLPDRAAGVLSVVRAVAAAPGATLPPYETAGGPQEVPREGPTVRVRRPHEDEQR